MLFKRCLLLFVFISAASWAWSENNEPSEQQLQNLIQQMNDIQAWLDRINREKSELQQALGQTERQISENLKRIDQLEQEISGLKKQIAELTQRQRRLRQQMDQQKQQIEQILIASYRQGQQNQLKLILNQTDPVLVRRMLNYAGYLSEDQQTILGQYQQDLAELSETQQKLTERQQQLQTSSQSLASRNQQLRQLQNDRQQVLAKLSAEQQSGGEQLEALKAERSSLEALLARMQNSIDQLATELDTPFARLKGRLNWPIAGKVVHRYGEQLGRGPLRWEGILLQNKAGTDVNAVHHGRVVFADWLKGFGLLVILDHGDGYMSLYGRNEVLLRSVGEWVNAGDALARTGDGGAGEEGLYFEIRHQGKPQNPAVWLAKR